MTVDVLLLAVSVVGLFYELRRFFRARAARKQDEALERSLNRILYADGALRNLRKHRDEQDSFSAKDGDDREWGEHWDPDKDPDYE